MDHGFTQILLVSSKSTIFIHFNCYFNFLHKIKFIIKIDYYFNLSLL